MRITSDHFNSIYNKNELKKQDGTASALKSNSRNFDAITIKSTSPEVAEKTFMSTMAKTLSEEVRKSASPEKLETLKSQIADGTYKIDAYAIASKILLLGGEDTNA